MDKPVLNRVEFIMDDADGKDCKVNSSVHATTEKEAIKELEVRWPNRNIRNLKFKTSNFNVRQESHA